MKVYSFILLVLIAVGAGLAYIFFNQDEKLDETVFENTTDSIRNLQTLDKNLLLLIHQSRFNSQFDNSSLTETNYELSEEFDNLRYEALFEEIEASAGLSDAVLSFEEKFFTREEALELYIDSNTKISESFDTISSTLDELNTLITPENSSLSNQFITQSSSLIYETAIGLNEITTSDRDVAINQIRGIEDLLPADNSELVSQYKEAAISFWENHDINDNAYTMLSALDTGPLLDNIENEYTAYHNLAIGNSAELRNALIAYGVALLCALLFFGYQIRKNFLVLEQKVTDRTEEIQTAYKDLQDSQEQLIQSEKMASLGEMVAGVAHEINTPLGYVTSNIDTIKLNLSDLNEVILELDKVYAEAAQKPQDKQKLTMKLLNTLKTHKSIGTQEVITESEQLLEDGAYGLSEISKLVLSLKDFARLDRQATEKIDLHQCIESSLTIASNTIKENNIEIVKQFGELSTITCMPSKLNQVFLNIINNACQSMADKNGALTISSSEIDEHAVITFKDEGGGIDDQTLPKIFDPFFTTKEIGKGTGLGLSIAYKIIKDHGGRIEVKSEKSKGTEMTIHLPIESKLSQEAA